ncbi:hypothetical protein ACH79_40835 [Bradyrhizobium sp. CCBAU 051011]|uniref:hypothetical protein n=1 Tax=Bradyrhizobium sp. CCBAU 051011 TaxID=858422 RepID=UPI0013739A0E|nr:hypothetical protein [Bradyrhizobium sp. CCBAU 051011]QHO77992.1 hypothetical protein ACH79_40835 [Bradyrhizobium sp. CCBAU 051011]
MLVSSLPLSGTIIAGTNAQCNHSIELARPASLAANVSRISKKFAREVIDNGQDAEAKTDLNF